MGGSFVCKAKVARKGLWFYYRRRIKVVAGNSWIIKKLTFLVKSSGLSSNLSKNEKSLKIQNEGEVRDWFIDSFIHQPASKQTNAPIFQNPKRSVELKNEEKKN